MRPYRTANRRLTRQTRDAAAAVEFVVLLPLLIVLCLVSVDFGRYAYAYLALSNAGRVGAEFLATRSYSTHIAAARQQEMESAALEDFSTTGGLDPDKLDITLEVTDDSYGLHRFTVTTSYRFQTAVAWPGIPNVLDMQCRISMRRFR